LYKVVEGKRSHHKGYKVRRENESVQKYTNNIQKRVLAGAQIRKQRYIIIFPNGESEEIEGLSAFCRTHNLNVCSMSAIAKGRRKSNNHKGFKCVALPEKKFLYTVKCANDEIVEVKDIKGFCSENSLVKGGLYYTKTNNKEYKGFKILKMAEIKN